MSSKTIKKKSKFNKHSNENKFIKFQINKVRRLGMKAAFWRRTDSYTAGESITISVTLFPRIWANKRQIYILSKDNQLSDCLKVKLKNKIILNNKELGNIHTCTGTHRGRCRDCWYVCKYVCLYTYFLTSVVSEIRIYMHLSYISIKYYMYKYCAPGTQIWNSGLLSLPKVNPMCLLLT